MEDQQGCTFTEHCSDKSSRFGVKESDTALERSRRYKDVVRRALRVGTEKKWIDSDLWNFQPDTYNPIFLGMNRIQQLTGAIARVGQTVFVTEIQVNMSVVPGFGTSYNGSDVVMAYLVYSRIGTGPGSGTTVEKFLRWDPVAAGNSFAFPTPEFQPEYCVLAKHKFVLQPWGLSQNVDASCMDNLMWNPRLKVALPVTFVSPDPEPPAIPIVNEGALFLYLVGSRTYNNYNVKFNWRLRFIDQ